MYIKYIEVEFDPAKSKSNKQKHGLDFKEAQRLWSDENRLEIQARQVLDEVRWAMIALLDQVVWTLIYTKRGDRVRIISVRRARDEEKELYYGK